jgi:hypothetical protein
MNKPHEYIVVAAIISNFVLYELMKYKIIGRDVNRTREKNAIIRLNNMISWQQDQTYVLPKELPTMNLFCKVSCFGTMQEE